MDVLNGSDGGRRALSRPRRAGDSKSGQASSMSAAELRMQIAGSKLAYSAQKLGNLMPVQGVSNTDDSISPQIAAIVCAPNGGEGARRQGIMGWTRRSNPCDRHI